MVIKQLDELQGLEEDFTDEQLAEIEKSVKEILRGTCGQEEKGRLIQYLDKQMDEEQFREYSKTSEEMKVLRLYEFAHSMRLDYEEVRDTFKNLGPIPMF